MNIILGSSFDKFSNRSLSNFRLCMFFIYKIKWFETILLLKKQKDPPCIDDKEDKAAKISLLNIAFSQSFVV